VHILLPVPNTHYAVTKKVIRVGKSLSIVLPSKVSTTLNITSESTFYVYVENGKIVYSLSKPRGVKCRRVKARIQARHGTKEYYVVTLPTEFSLKLGIKEGSLVLLLLTDKGLVVESLKP